MRYESCSRLAALARADDRVADLGGAVAVLERRADRGRRRRRSAIARRRWRSSFTNVSPQPMMWPGGHQNSQNGWSASETSTVLKPRARSPSARKTWSSFSRSMSNASEPFEPLISHWNALRRPSARRVDSIVPIGAALELDRRLDRVVHLAAGQERLHERRDRRDVADEVAREVDDVRAEVAERARARLVRRGSARCRATGRRPSPGGSARGSGGSRRARRRRSSRARAAPPGRSGS